MYNKKRALKLIMFLLILFHLGFLITQGVGTTQGVSAKDYAIQGSRYQGPQVPKSLLSKPDSMEASLAEPEAQKPGIQSPVEAFFNKYENKKYTQFGYKIFQTTLHPRIPVVGPDYLLRPGDAISIKMWGQSIFQLRSANKLQLRPTNNNTSSALKKTILELKSANEKNSSALERTLKQLKSKNEKNSSPLKRTLKQLKSSNGKNSYLPELLELIELTLKQLKSANKNNSSALEHSLSQLRPANKNNSSLLEYNLIVGQKGHLLLPEFGPLPVSGLCLGNLEGILTTKYQELYKDCQVAIALSNIRKIEVLVTGQVNNPGYVSVQAGSTVYEALLASGGSTKMGSLRNVMLRQADNQTQMIDLYRLIVSQDEVHLPQLREKDILSVPHIGPTVLIKGQIRCPGIYELTEGENLNDLVRYAGGAFPNTNLNQIKISRFDSAGGRQIMHIKSLNTKVALQDGDLVTLTDLTRSKLEEKLMAEVCGAVQKSGKYPIGKDTRLVDILKEAGGLIPEAYLPGLVLIRPNAQKVQTAYRQVAVELLKKDLVWQSAESAREYLSEEEKNEKKQAVAVIQSYLSHLESQAPEGRIVLASDSLVSLEKFEQSCSNVPLKNGDRIFVPTTPDFISIVGEIYRPSSYLFLPKKKMTDYLALAGGISPYADFSASFLVRSSGKILSYQQKQKQFLQMVMQPGDVVVLPSKVLRIQGGI